MVCTYVEILKDIIAPAKRSDLGLTELYVAASVHFDTRTARIAEDKEKGASPHAPREGGLCSRCRLHSLVYVCRVLSTKHPSEAVSYGFRSGGNPLLFLQIAISP